VATDNEKNCNDKQLRRITIKTLQIVPRMAGFFLPRSRVPEAIYFSSFIPGSRPIQSPFIALAQSGLECAGNYGWSVNLVAVAWLTQVVTGG
jgi:hypothetical protein